MRTPTKLKPSPAAYSLVALLLAPLGSPALAAPQFRSDLQAKLAPLACQAKQANPSVEQLWQQGVYDADLSLHVVRRQVKKGEAQKTGHDQTKLARMAQSFAIANRHLGYNFGVCSGEHAWLSSVPAPEPLARVQADFEVPRAVFDEHCQQLFFDFAAASQHSGETLNLSGNRRLILPPRPGLVSVACQPRRPSWLGPKPWFLIPTTLTALNVPSPEHLQGHDDGASLASWINAVRRAEHLPLLTVAELSSPLGAAVTTLGLGASLDHDRALMQTVARSLQKKGWQAIGENRVRGHRVTELATLLWYSPRHRRLLLHRTATHLSYALHKEQAGLFFVMLLGRQSPMTISKRPSPSAQPKAKAL